METIGAFWVSLLIRTSQEIILGNAQFVIALMDEEVYQNKQGIYRHANGCKGVRS